MTVYERIRAARKSKNLTQKNVADILGVTQASYQQYENGKRNPKFETLQRIAIALDVSIFNLVTDDKELHAESVVFGDLADCYDKDIIMAVLADSEYNSSINKPYDGTIRINADNSMGLDLERVKELSILIENETDEAKLAEYKAEFAKYEEYFRGLAEYFKSEQFKKIVDKIAESAQQIQTTMNELSPDNQKAALSYINYLKEQEDIAD